MPKYRLFAQAGDIAFPTKHSVVIVTDGPLTDDELNDDAMQFMWETVQPEFWYEQLDDDDPAEDGDS